MEVFLLQLFIFLGAAALAVPIAKKLGLGSVLGYLIAGIVIGPYGLSLIPDVEQVMHFTEFGVVMMLFLVGLELKPSMLWQMRTPILGMGGAQVLFSALFIGAVTIFFLPWQQALSIALILALSSTAIVLQTLQEKGLMNSAGGRSIFSVLLFQDLAVIPMLAVLPLMATLELHHEKGHGESVLLDLSTLPAYQHLIVTLLTILAVFFLAKFASRPIFRTIAATRVREIFVAAALALVVGISLLMSVVGLSPALGTFLAGVVLADSEYRHELESDIAPFKGLLLGIFFISIGASLNFTLIGNKILLIAAITAGLLVLKALALIITGLIFKMPAKQRRFFAIALAQGGEFAFVLFQFSKVNGVLPQETTEPFISAVAISMFLAPLLFLAYDRIASSRKMENESKRESDTIDVKGHKVILAGFGRLGLDLGRFLISAGIRPVIVDHDPDNVDLLRKFGFKVYYGDITRLDLLEAAGAAEAELLIITIDDNSKALKLIELVRKHYPHLKISVNAADRSSTYKLMDAGMKHIRRETFGTALEMGQDALLCLGIEPYEAYRLMRLFRKRDEECMPELYKMHRQDEVAYRHMYQRHMNDTEELMKLDGETEMEELDRAWTVANPES